MKKFFSIIVLTLAMCSVFAQEETYVDLIIDSYNTSYRVNLIKETRYIQGVGLQEAKAAVEAIPGVWWANITYPQAAAALDQLQDSTAWQVVGRICYTGTEIEYNGGTLVIDEEPALIRLYNAGSRTAEANALIQRFAGKTESEASAILGALPYDFVGLDSALNFAYQMNCLGAKSFTIKDSECERYSMQLKRYSCAKLTLVKIIKAYSRMGLTEAVNAVTNNDTLARNLSLLETEVLLDTLYNLDNTIEFVIGDYCTGEEDPYAACNARLMVGGVSSTTRDTLNCKSFLQQWGGLTAAEADSVIDSCDSVPYLTVREMPMDSVVYLDRLARLAGFNRDYIFPVCECGLYDITVTHIFSTTSDSLSLWNALMPYWEMSQVEVKDSINRLDGAPIEVVKQARAEDYTSLVYLLLRNYGTVSQSYIFTLVENCEGIEPDIEDAVENVAAEQIDMNAAVEVYNMLGQRMGEGILRDMQMAAGIYLIRQGHAAMTISIR